MSDIIAAVATGHMPCAIGILRLSGDGCIAVADRVFTPARGSLLDAPARTLIFGTLRDRKGRVIDQALAVCSHAPHSYTGEDTVELQCHGSPAMLASALEALFAAGARQARRGEFTRRAFLNGKLDLTQAEAVIDLIDAESADAAANAAGQLGGALLRRIAPVYDELTQLCSHFHAVLDYPDEDIEDFTAPEMERTLASAAASLDTLLQSYDRGRQLTHGVQTVLLGRPNSGKSSLFNALAGFERVIVTDIAGTTRDTVQETIRAGSVLLRLTDTAGIRETTDRIEAIGVERSQQAAIEAELALFVCDASQPWTQADAQALALAQKAPVCIGILNKSDLPACLDSLPTDETVSLSAASGEGLDRLIACIEAHFGGEAHCDGSLLTNARHFGALQRAKEAILRAQAALSQGITPDAVLTDAEAAMSALGEVTGRTVREDITNRIFERFCVGK